MITKRLYHIACHLLLFAGLALMVLSADGQDSVFVYTFGGEGEDACLDISATADSGFLMVGSTGSFGRGSSDIYLVKLNQQLEHEWSKTIGGANVEWATAVDILADSGFVLAGYANDFFSDSGYDMLLTRIDTLGIPIWQKRFGGTDWEFGRDVLVVNDGIVIAGETSSFGNGSSDAYIVKTDFNGSILWTQVFGHSGRDGFTALAQTFDGNLVAAGYQTPEGSSTTDFFLVKLDQFGQLVWESTIGDTGEEEITDIIEDTDSNLVFVGFQTSGSLDNDENSSIGKVDRDGSEVWTVSHHQFPGGNNQDDRANAIVELNNGKYCMVGTTMTYGGGKGDFFNITTNTDGSWTSDSRTFGDGELDDGQAILVLDNGFLLAGTSESYGSGFSDMAAIFTESFAEVQNPPTYVVSAFADTLDLFLSTNPKTETTDQVAVYPNPAISFAQFEIMGEKVPSSWLLRLYGTNGQLVLENKASPGQRTMTISLDEFTPGPYFYELRSGSEQLKTGILISK